MKRFFTPLLFVSIFIASSCDRLDDFAGNGDNGEDEETPAETGINFNFKNTIQVGGEGTAEISAFDPLTNKLFVVNVEVPEISTFDLSDINNVVRLNPIICVLDGTPNSVAVSNGKLAVALEAPNSQKRGHVELFDTDTQGELGVFTVGSLPDMVTFTPDGNHIVVANEGEPNEDYTIDPQGTVSIISVDSGVR